MIQLLGSHPLGLLTRLVHVISMAFMLGGSLLLFGLILSTRKETAASQISAVLSLARKYEGCFWLAFGLIVLTGVGNLGAFGNNLPGTDTPWGMRFGVKLALAAVFLLLSLPRTLLTAGLPEGPSTRKVLGRLYAATATFLIVLLALAILLAHG